MGNETFNQNEMIVYMRNKLPHVPLEAMQVITYACQDLHRKNLSHAITNQDATEWLRYLADVRNDAFVNKLDISANEMIQLATDAVIKPLYQESEHPAIMETIEKFMLKKC